KGERYAVTRQSGLNMKYRVIRALMTARFDFQKLEISQEIETNPIFLI
ncbi:hypothetical protein dsmv_3634, partial [Desulfococcus multivorans DSM 2059]